MPVWVNSISRKQAIKIVGCQKGDSRQYGHLIHIFAYTGRSVRVWRFPCVRMYSCIYEISILLSMLFISICLKWGTKHTKTRVRPGKLHLLFHISPFTQFAHVQAVIIHYSLLTNAVYTQQIYGTMAIKSGCVIAWKVIMTVEGAGPRSEHWCETINQVWLA